MQSVIEPGIVKPPFSVNVFTLLMFGSSTDIHQAAECPLQRNQGLERAKSPCDDDHWMNSGPDVEGPFFGVPKLPDRRVMKLNLIELRAWICGSSKAHRIY